MIHQIQGYSIYGIKARRTCWCLLDDAQLAEQLRQDGLMVSQHLPRVWERVVPVVGPQDGCEDFDYAWGDVLNSFAGAFDSGDSRAR